MPELASHFDCLGTGSSKTFKTAPAMLTWWTTPMSQHSGLWRRKFSTTKPWFKPYMMLEMKMQHASWTSKTRWLKQFRKVLNWPPATIPTWKQGLAFERGPSTVGFEALPRPPKEKGKMAKFPWAKDLGEPGPDSRWEDCHLNVPQIWTGRTLEEGVSTVDQQRKFQGQDVSTGHDHLGWGIGGSSDWLRSFEDPHRWVAAHAPGERDGHRPAGLCQNRSGVYFPWWKFWIHSHQREFLSSQVFSKGPLKRVSNV